MLVQFFARDIISSVTDTTVVSAIFGHFDIFIPSESSLHRASNDAIIFVVLQINLKLLSKMQISKFHSTTVVKKLVYDSKYLMKLQYA